MAGSCLPILGAVLIAPVLPRMQDHFATTPGAEVLVPVVLTVPALALALLAPFAGVLVDRLGRGRLLTISTVVYALVGTAPLWLDSLSAIVASRVLVGIAEAAIMTCCTTLIGDYWSGRERERYLALQAMCASLSATAFFVLGGAAGSAGWRAPFWAYAVGLVLAPLMASRLRPVHPETASDTRSGERRPFPLRSLTAPCALTFFGAIVFYTVPVEMSYLLEDLGVTSAAAAGLAAAAASAATVAGAASFPRLARRAEALLPLVFAVCAAGFAVMCFAPSTSLLVLGAVVNCLATGLLLPTLVTRTLALLLHEDRGRGTGLWNAAFFLGEFLCPLALLGLAGAVGTLAGAVGVLAAVTAVVALGLAVTRARRGATPATVEAAAV
ncbi:MFS transporter [Kitasatospora herbaricolor]|uniref:MFS transporter n=2 Tax=Kitasatospora herbaricolor TaxID=68217 RepID=A0ABZ1WMD7_9ACTN|nr:MFS transporter [Kitasatospora herbaricolor]